MRRTAVLLVASVAGAILAGCVTTSQFMKARSQGARADVFEEVGEKDTVPREYALLEIRASIKTHTEGFYLLESRDSLHGKKGYPFVLNIDGQAVVWKVDGREEIIPIHFEKGGRNPEGGAGVRYAIRKRIRLAAGSYRLYFGLPAEDYYREFDVKLTAGRTYALTFEPVYKQRIPNLQRIPDIRRFTNGFDRYEKVWTEIRPDPA
jgi:hypothetical protein